MVPAARMNAPRPRIDRLLLVAFLVYCAASLVHFSHNAIYIEDYPNLPVWLTPFKVYAVWFAEAAFGLAGFVLCLKGARRIGLVMIAIYAALAFDGLGHYALAPVSAHTFTMNFTIWSEVLAGTLLLAIAGTRLAQSRLVRRES
jgi:hypothetical protein